MKLFHLQREYGTSLIIFIKNLQKIILEAIWYFPITLLQILHILSEFSHLHVIALRYKSKNTCHKQI